MAMAMKNGNENENGNENGNENRNENEWQWNENENENGNGNGNENENENGNMEMKTKMKLKMKVKMKWKSPNGKMVSHGFPCFLCTSQIGCDLKTKGCKLVKKANYLCDMYCCKDKDNCNHKEIGACGMLSFSGLLLCACAFLVFMPLY